MVTKTVDIPGGTAQISDTLSVRQRHDIESAAVAAASALDKLPKTREELETVVEGSINLTREEARSLFVLQEATIIATLASWSLPGPIPNENTIGDMDPDVYDALAAATTEIGVATVAPVDFNPTDPAGADFQASPTTPSGGSAAASRADQEPASTEPQPNDGTSTGSAEPSQD
jgi:hypothetical protein